MNFAVVCASNFNRSMEAHKVFSQAGMQVRSFGVGQQVKLPGASAREPNVYAFGTPYSEIYADLKGKDTALYTRNGLLTMLERNMQLKTAPERWQLNSDVFDVVVAFEERVFDIIVEDMQSRGNMSMQPVLILNLDVKDNAEEASLAAPQALELCQMLAASEDWETELEDILDRFQTKMGRRPIYPQ